MAQQPYSTVQQLVDALGLPAYMAIFDDTASGSRVTVDTSTGVTTCMLRAHAEVASFMPAILNVVPAEQPAANVSVLLQHAELDFAVCLAYRRHPEYVKTYGADPGGPMYKECVARMTRIQAGTQQIAPNDNPPATPGNLGGSSLVDGARIATSNIDGTSNLGDF